MSFDEVQRFMGRKLESLGFTLNEVQNDLIHAELPAWAVYYNRSDCKLQVCWTAREGGVDFMLAHPDAPNEIGVANRSKCWYFMLALSEVDDDLGIPPLNASPGTLWAWRNALFDTHFGAAHAALVRQT